MKKFLHSLRGKAGVMVLALVTVALAYTAVAQTPSVAKFISGTDLQNKYAPVIVTDQTQTPPSGFASVFANLSDLKIYSEKADSFGNIEVNGVTKVIGSGHFGSVSTAGTYATSGIYVNGNILSTALADLSATNLRYVCSNEDGLITLCGNGPATYSWYTSAWGSCSGVQAGSCSGTYQGVGNCSGTFATGSCRTTTGSCMYNMQACVTDSNGYNPCYEQDFVPSKNAICKSLSQSQCNVSGECAWVTQPATNPNCSQYTTQLACDPILEIFPNGCSWEVGPSSSCAGATTQSSCLGQGNGIFPSCIWSAPTNSCSGPTTSSACTAQNAACTWNDAASGIQTRTVECRDNLGAVVPDGQCTTTKPALTQSC